MAQRNSIAVAIDTNAFHSGFVEGMTGERDGHTIPALHPGQSITEGDIVAIIRNQCEVAQEGWLTEEHLRHDCGLVVGWLNRPNVQIG